MKHVNELQRHGRSSPFTYFLCSTFYKVYTKAALCDFTKGLSPRLISKGMESGLKNRVLKMVYLGPLSNLETDRATSLQSCLSLQRSHPLIFDTYLLVQVRSD